MSEEKPLIQIAKERLEKSRKEREGKILEEIRRKEEERKKFLRQIIMELHGVKVLLFETKVWKFKWGESYSSVVALKDGDYVSKPFTVDYKEDQEFKRKLTIEILRYLSLKRRLGEVVRRW
ncbi:MAG: hypothetical protein ACTSVA_05025 [Candidatus Njordarchaeales archaeon]|nr:MAG: hypothetical protein DRN38_00105 [Thermococci archaeon]